MNIVDLTPEKLAEIKKDAKTYKHVFLINPATVLAMVEEIEHFRQFIKETLNGKHECYGEEGCKICQEIDRVFESEAGQ